MKIYSEHILDELGSMANITALSSLEAKKIINNKIDSINLYVKKIKPKVNKGWFNNFLFDSSDPSYDDESLMAYEDYRQKYLEEVTSGIGILLATKRLQRSAGRLKTMENDEYESSDRVKNTTSYHFKAHSRVTDSDVIVAYREASFSFTFFRKT
ncbi:MAG: hypothetical protein QF441_12435 [Bacteriovoracaceae bacterium]|nr:hypothetical protein [Bacteriovoracaceae bacterium]